MHYQVVEQLQQFKSKLLDSVTLSSGMQLAKWHNQHDQVSVCSNHHTLRLYVDGGLAPHQYVMQHRLRLAHQAILTQSQSMSQIALDYGFSSSSHFSARFKKHFGYSPSQLKAD